MIALTAGRSWRSRRSRAAGLLAGTGIGLLVALAPAVAPAHAQSPAQSPPPTYAQGDGPGVVETEWGPLTASDRDLLVRVRYAGLWEIPGGTMAAERGVSERVREIGANIAEEHRELDALVVEAAGKLGVELPDEPYATHAAYLERMDGAFGEDFDQEFVQLLREQHGLVYPIIAYVRVGTENELIREFAATSEEFIGRHMDYLESTNQVDWNLIKPAPEPAGTTSRFLSTEPAGVNPVFIWILLGVAAVAGGVTVVRTIRPR